VLRFPNLARLLNPNQEPQEPDSSSDIEYASFSGRAFALTLDMLLLFLVFSPFYEFMSQILSPEFYLNRVDLKLQQLFLAYAEHEITGQQLVEELQAVGAFQKMALDYLMQIILSGIVIIFLWVKFDTTLGLFVQRMYVADSKDGGKPTFTQYMIRYIIGVIAILPMMLGMLTIFFTEKKMAIHDMAAGTVILQRKFFWKRREKDAD
jgi:uncharacterized RDD family membrane protein YckC